MINPNLPFSVHQAFTSEPAKTGKATCLIKDSMGSIIAVVPDWRIAEWLVELANVTAPYQGNLEELKNTLDA